MYMRLQLSSVMSLQDQFHGCPYRTFNATSLTAALGRLKLPAEAGKTATLHLHVHVVQSALHYSTSPLSCTTLHQPAAHEACPMSAECHHVAPLACWHACALPKLGLAQACGIILSVCKALWICLVAGPCAQMLGPLFIWCNMPAVSEAAAKAKAGHFQLACAAAWEGQHSCSCDTGINHPNQVCSRPSIS